MPPAPWSGPVAEGCVGAGTGTSAFGYKAGIGTSSRLIEIAGEAATIGVLVQSNFGGRLRIDGIDFGRAIAPTTPDHGSSIMIIIATDLPLDNRLLNRVAKRATLGLARTGANGGHGSGDYIIACSTTCRTPSAMPASRAALAANEGEIDTAFQAVADAIEEAILNSLFQAERMTGWGGHVREAIDCEQLRNIRQRQ